ncbi:MAG: hypothetical protein KAJ39_01690 [Gammaproteobacteria bacterium]|nr:hypothetical protein [Gammaproteobacteria bacterium]
MSKKIIINVLLLAVFITMATTLGGVKVFKKSDLYAVSCGRPLSFITQDQGWRDPPYPWRVPCTVISLESPTKFHWGRFAFDVAFFYLLVLAVYYYLKPDRKKNAKEKQDQIEN